MLELHPKREFSVARLSTRLFKCFQVASYSAAADVSQLHLVQRFDFSAASAFTSSDPLGFCFYSNFRSQPDGPRGGEQRRDRFHPPESGEFSNDNSSAGQIVVAQVEDNRLTFTSGTYSSSTTFNEELSRYPNTKDSDRAKNYVQLRWHFRHSFLQSEESMDLLIALDKIVDILKVLDDSHSQQPQGDRYPNDGCGTGSDFKFAEVHPEKSDTKVESTRCKNFVLEDGEDLGSPEETRVRNPGHLGNGYVDGCKRKSLSEDKDSPGSSVDYEREKIRARLKRMREENKTIDEGELDSRCDDSRYYETEKEYSMSNAQQRPSRETRKTAREFVAARKAVDLNQVKNGGKSAVDMRDVEGVNHFRRERDRKGKAVFNSERQSQRNFKPDSDTGWEEEEKNSTANCSALRKRSVSEVAQERQGMSKSASGGARQLFTYGTSAFVMDTESEDANDEQRSSDLLPRRKRKMRVLNEVYGNPSGSSDHDTEPQAENGFDSEEEIVGSNSPSSNNKKVKRRGSHDQEARRDCNPGRGGGDRIKRIQAKGNGETKLCRKSRLEGLILPEVDQAFQGSKWELMDARTKVETILDQFQYLELYFRVRVTRGMVAKETARKFYVYDSLYDVMQYYEETGASGHKVWKFKLVKRAEQPDSSIPENVSISSEAVIHLDFLSVNRL
ncbi:hypothetical protein R1flu_024124 [Riccia fluitans]|uniref:YDG domain-containing protein n=1 Tax=Riccia fluitans TaxID=41844 RepID=A0ABD1XU61_9MARC